MSFPRVFVVACIAMLCVAAQPASQPATRPAFDEAVRAMQHFKLAEGIKCEIFAAEPQLANPVALTCDDRGRVWVVETFRFEGLEGEPGGVHDIRHMYDRLDEDLACKTVEDRLAALKKWYHNDLSAHTQYCDRIRVLEDTNGDGRADRATIFSDDFHDALDGVAAGILVRGEDVYFADIPHLWLLRDDDHDGRGEYKTSLSYGYGVRYNFLGHDLHGLRMGPEGKIYFSIGDRGLHVVTKEGRVIDQPDTGSVLRCDPDGSNLELFATGLRNPQDLVFDDFGNLFTGDNNCDHGDPARWVYVVEGGDSGWRVGYQHQETPGPAGPWLAEKLYALESPANAAYIVPPIAHIAAGPSGNAYYPGTGLSSRYRGHFFLCDFRGGTGSVIHCFSLKPKGASFELKDIEPFIENCVVTDVKFSPDGGAYVADWIAGFGKLDKGRVWRLFDPQAQHSAAALETRKFLAEGMTNRSPIELQSLLGHADMRVRQAAQFELTARGRPSLPTLEAVAREGDTRLARVHAIWAIAQIARRFAVAEALLPPLLDDRDEEVRAQAAKVIGDLRLDAAGEKLTKLLDDPSPRVRFFAAIALGKIRRHEALPAVLAMLARDGEKDAFLRHAAVMALVDINDVPAMISAAQYAAAPTRIGVVLALRRLNRPEIAAFLHDPDPAVVLEAARAINDEPINEAKPALAQLIAKHDLPEPVMLRVLNMNFRLDHARAIVDFAKDERASPTLRVEALAELGQWAAPSGRDRVIGVWRPLAKRDGALAASLSRAALTTILRGAPPNVRLAGIELAKNVGLDDSRLLFELVASANLPEELRAAALEAMAARHDPYLPDAVEYAFDNSTGALHRAAIRLSGQSSDAPARLGEILQRGSVADQQAVFAMLATVQPRAADETLLRWLDKLIAKTVPPELQLDILTAAEKSSSPRVREQLAQFEATRPKDDALARFRECLAGGDAAAGRKVFFQRADVSCLRCHRVAGEGGAIGPDLTGLGAKKDREYLLASIVAPNKQIAAGYETVQLKLKDGTFRSGTVKSETASEVVLDVVDKGAVHVSKDQIVSRSAGLSAMPEDIAKPLAKRDLRDLVEFLAEQRQAPATTAAIKR